MADGESVPSESEAPVLPADVVSPAVLVGSFRLVRVFATDVHLHWSWFIAAWFLIGNRAGEYSSIGWNIAEYVAGFLLVLFHEFGHVAGCRMVGGTASRVVLWPLGGLAFVAAPPRPWANFWTTLAGPLVNLAFAPLLFALAYATGPADDADPGTDLFRCFQALAWFNLVMLVFNLLPIYPMDGGRLLQAVLWRFLGRVWALTIAAVIGFAGAACLGVFAAMYEEWWLLAVAMFLGLGAFHGVRQALLVSTLETAERRSGLACPSCGCAPPRGKFWRCHRCLGTFDLFSVSVECSKGGQHATDVSCLTCDRQLAPAEWLPTPSDDGPR